MVKTTLERTFMNIWLTAAAASDKYDIFYTIYLDENLDLSDRVP